MESATSQDTQRRALALFNESLEQPEADRYRWLAAECQEQPELLALVLKLLAADQVKDSLLDQPVLPNVLAGPGDRAGSFELLEEIGAGGAGRVFRARRADGEFEQEVAVKVFETQRMSGPMLARFHAERQILATLEHPGIARLIDGGTTDSGLPYVAMELIRGQSITAYCAQQKLDVPSRLALLQKVCDALDVAHDRGIIHRDIKPGNVLVDEDGEPRVIDFGIAKVIDPGAFGLPDGKTLTRFQALTPEYASPEQVLGEKVSQSTDVYSLGVMLYEMLTGVRPYQISTLTPAEVERTVCHTIPDDPSERVSKRRSAPPLGLTSAGELKRQLRGDIDRIVMTALSKEPDRRYRSAGSLSRDIERYLSGHPVNARGASRLYRTGKFLQRHRTVSIAVAVVIIALSGALISVTQSARLARQEADRAEAAKSFLLEMISTSDPFQSGGETTIADAVLGSIPSIDSDFAGQPALQADLRYTIGIALSGQAKVEAAREQLQLALGHFQVHGPPRNEAKAHAQLGTILWNEGDFENARTAFEKAKALAAKDSSTLGRTVYLDTLIGLTGLLPNLERYDEAVDLGLEAQTLIAQGVTVDTLNHAVLYNNLAVVYDYQENYSKSVEAYEKSIELHREISDAHPDLAIALGNLAQTYELLGDLEKAVEASGEAYRMIAGNLGVEHPETLVLRHNYGSLMLNAKRLAEAVVELQAVADMAPEAYGEEHLYTGRFHYKVALARQQLGEVSKAQHHAGLARRAYLANEDTPESWFEQLDTMDQQLKEAAVR